MALNAGQLKHLFATTYQEWNEDQAPRLGAALAYYTTLSMAPLLILLIALAGLVFGEEAARGQLFGEIRNMVGTDGAKAIEDMVASANKPGQGIFAAVVGFLTLAFGASSVAAELKYSLNIVWGRDPDPNSGVKEMVKERSSALVVVLGCGFLLLVSLALSGVIAAAGTYVSHLLPLPEFVLQTLNTLVGLVVIAGVFAVLFRFLPDVHLQWGDVLPGAFFTALLFTAGKFAIGMYLGKAGIASTYGAAGSLVVVLVWVYYSAQIMFFGAEFTQVYACEHGSDPRRRRNVKPPDVPKSMVAAEYETPVAAGGAALPTGNENPAGGFFGTLIGSALALTKVVRGFRR